MSIFGKILDKLGLHKDKDSPATGRTQAPSQAQMQGARPSSPHAPTQSTPHTNAPGAQRTTPPATSAQAQAARPAQAAPQAARPAAMSDTDVVAKLEKLAAQSSQPLNWRTSIVDLMKLLGMESTLAERKELAEELGYPRDQMDDTARMNVWLHKQVLRKIAENGGNVPKEMLN